MNETTKATSSEETLEDYLQKACLAEARGDRAEADRLLALALARDRLQSPGAGHDEG